MTSMKRSRRELSIDIWLFVRVSLKLTKLRFSLDLPSYLKPLLVFTVLSEGKFVKSNFPLYSFSASDVTKTN